MILLTKINNAPIAVNCDLIEYIEETPDAVVTLLNNDKVVVRESMEEIIRKIVEYRRALSGLVEVSTTRSLKPVLRLTDECGGVRREN
jgi:flagellar protein FlbD